MLPLVYEKHVDMGLIVRDQSVAELYILDKLQRQASYQLLKTLVAQLEAACPDPI